MPPPTSAAARLLPAPEPTQRELLERVLALVMPPAEAAPAAGRLILRYGTVAGVLDAPLPALRDGGFGLPPPVAEALARVKGNAAAIAAVAAARAGEAAEARARRRRAGEWVRSLRHATGLSQRELAAAVGSRCYTVVDQIEAGAGRVAWRDVPAWAAALRVEPTALARGLLRAYEPDLDALLGGCGCGDAAAGPAGRGAV